jgi:hypothetical protein
MKNKILLFALFFVLFSANAQNETEKTETEKTETVVPAEIVVPTETEKTETVVATETATVTEIGEIKKNALSFNLGFLGVGYARLLNDHFSARVKVSFVNVDIDKRNLTLSDRQIDVRGKFKSQIVDLFVDYLPFKKSSFKLVTGVSYLHEYKGSIDIIAVGPLEYGDITLGRDDIGGVYTSADWSGVTPYLGLGFGRAIPKNKFGVSLDIGGYFVGKSEFVFDASKMLAPNSQKEKESHEIQDFMDQFQVMPSIMLHFSYKL